LKNELTAINQYFLHARMLTNWGLGRLGKHEYEESIDEMKHAEALVERVLYLEGVPNLQRLGTLRIGETVLEQFQSDLAVEHAALERLGNGIALCLTKADHGSRELLESILTDEEDHVDWLETQLETVNQIGIEHYLAHDRCIAATMRALGYPCRGTLTKWMREAFPEARRAVVGSVGQRRYPESFKQSGVMELCTRQESAQAVADKLGVCRPTLYNWKNQLLGREAPASMKHTNQSPQARERDELECQVEALRREVRQLRLEQDLLNKANELLKKAWASICSSCPTGRRHC